jgi:uncharacterized membrane protein
MVNAIRRFLIHLFGGPWLVRRYFSLADLQAIATTITANERLHAGQIRFVVESVLHPYQLWRGVTPRQRALTLFSELGIWDAEQNNGVLIYLLLADHDVEIVADRGISRHVPAEQWEAICHEMEDCFRQHQFLQGVQLGVGRIGELIAKHYPPVAQSSNELPDQPVLL